MSFTKKQAIILVALLSVAIISGVFMVNELCSNLLSKEPDYESYQEDTIQFLLEEFWDQAHHGFYTSDFREDCCSETWSYKYTSYNIWVVRALLQYSISRNNISIFENYGLKTLNFIFTHLQNSTNKGFYHWVLENGSLPAKDSPSFNFSVFQIGTYQAWVLLVLTEIYQYLQNMTYINVWGNKIANFLITTLWDSKNGGFYSVYLPFYDIYSETYKYSWYQAWPAIALMSLYQITGNRTYMNYVNSCLDFLITYLWKKNLNCFVYHRLEDGTPDPDWTTKITLTDQAGCLLALLKAASITGNQSYWDDYIVPSLNFTKHYLWDDDMGQFYAEVAENGSNPDLTNRPSDLCIWLYTLLELMENFNNSNSLNNMLISSLSHLHTYAWDLQNKGFFRNFYINGTVIDKEKWTIEQTIPLFLYCQFFSESPKNFVNFGIYTSIFIGSTITLVYFFFKCNEKGKLKQRHNFNTNKWIMFRRELVC